MFLIVLFHGIIYWQDGGGSRSSASLSFLANWLAGFHNYTFFLVSGYIYYALRIEKGKYSEYKPFFIGKIKRLAVPAVFMAFIWVAPINGYLYHYTLRDFILKIVLADHPSHLWFLWALFFVFVVFWPLTDFFKESVFCSLAIVGSFYVVSQVGGHFLNIEPFCIFDGCYYLWYFFLGFKLRQTGRQLSQRKILAGLILYTMSFALSYAPPQTGLLWKLITRGFGILRSTLGAVTAFSTLQYLADRVNWKDNKLFHFFAKRAMPIYLFHQQITHISQSLLDGVVHPYANAAINIIAALTISTAISSLMLRYKVTRHLIGEK